MQDLAPIAGPIAEIGAFGLVVWLVLHTFKHTIPRLADDFKSSTAKILAAHLEAIEKLTDSHETMIREMRADQREDRREMLTKLDQLSREFQGIGLIVAQWQPEADRKRMEEISAKLERIETRIDSMGGT